MKLYRLVDENKKSKIVSKKELQKIVDETGLDIIVLAETEKEIVVKIGDKKKEEYQKKRKEREKKKKSKKTKIKEIRITPNCSEHDLFIKEKQIRKMLENGNIVRISLRLRGREKLHFSKYFSIIEDFSNRFSCKKERRGKEIWLR